MFPGIAPPGKPPLFAIAPPIPVPHLPFQSLSAENFQPPGAGVCKSSGGLYGQMLFFIPVPKCP
jgi:hypothetical protein